MRFRVGLGLGLAVGYVLGTKAGRERFEQIKETAEGVWSSPKVEQMREQAERVIDKVAARDGNGRRITLDPAARESFMAAGLGDPGEGL